jgi:hypothetical protein
MPQFDDFSDPQRRYLVGVYGVLHDRIEDHLAHAFGDAPFDEAAWGQVRALIRDQFLALQQAAHPEAVAVLRAQSDAYWTARTAQRS